MFLHETRRNTHDCHITLRRCAAHIFLQSASRGWVIIIVTITPTRVRANTIRHTVLNAIWFVMLCFVSLSFHFIAVSGGAFVATFCRRQHTQTVHYANSVFVCVGLFVDLCAQSGFTSVHWRKTWEAIACGQWGKTHAQTLGQCETEELCCSFGRRYAVGAHARMNWRFISYFICVQ